MTQRRTKCGRCGREDDGQIARELVPVDEAFMRKDEEEERTRTTLGLEQKCNTVSKPAYVSVERRKF